MRKLLARKRTLTRKQHAQRKYAAMMKGVRARAASARGGKGRVADRPAASTLRRKYHLKHG